MAGQKGVQGSTHAWGTPWGHSSPPPVGSHPGGVWGAEPQRGGGETQQRGHRSTTAAFAARGEETRTRGRAHTRTALRPGPRGGCRRGGPAPVPVPVEEAARCGAVRRALTRRWRRSGARRWRCGAVRRCRAPAAAAAARGGAGLGGSAPGRALPALRAPPAAPGAAPNGAARRGTGRHGAARDGTAWGVRAAGCGRVSVLTAAGSARTGNAPRVCAVRVHGPRCAPGARTPPVRTALLVWPPAGCAHPEEAPCGNTPVHSTGCTHTPRCPQ